jgi:hypothetical protein
MMRSCASAAKLRGGAPILFPGTRAIGGYGKSPPRMVSMRRLVGAPITLKSVAAERLVVRSGSGAQGDAVRDHARRREAPQRDQ